MDEQGWLKRHFQDLLAGMALLLFLFLLLGCCRGLTATPPPWASGGGCSMSSSTRATMSNLKTALICYQADIGHLPCDGPTMTVEGFERANRNLLSWRAADNVLLTCGPATAPTLLPPQFATDPARYGRRWKGPYMDCESDEFMRDAWGNRISYGVHDTKVILHSAGEDGCFEPAAEVLKSGYCGDDLLVCVTRLKVSPPREYFLGDD